MCRYLKLCWLSTSCKIHNWTDKTVIQFKKLEFSFISITYIVHLSKVQKLPKPKPYSKCFALCLIVWRVLYWMSSFLGVDGLVTGRFAPWRFAPRRFAPKDLPRWYYLFIHSDIYRDVLKKNINICDLYWLVYKWSCLLLQITQC